MPEAEENTALNDCFYEKKDWRACKTEVSVLYNCGRTSPNRDYSTQIRVAEPC